MYVEKYNVDQVTVDWHPGAARSDDYRLATARPRAERQNACLWWW